MIALTTFLMPDHSTWPLVQKRGSRASVWTWQVLLSVHPLETLIITGNSGVYFAKDGAISTGSYSMGAQTCWRNSASRVTNCVALAEIVNLPGKFVSQSPYFVVDKTDWIIWCVRRPTSNCNVRPTAL